LKPIKKKPRSRQVEAQTTQVTDQAVKLKKPP